MSEKINNDDVISVCYDRASFFSLSPVFKPNELLKVIGDALYQQWNSNEKNLVGDGVQATLLRPKHPKGWRTGKIKISLEFIPDPPEDDEPIDLPNAEIIEMNDSFPLDDVRLSLMSSSTNENKYDNSESV